MRGHALSRSPARANRTLRGATHDAGRGSCLSSSPVPSFNHLPSLQPRPRQSTLPLPLRSALTFLHPSHRSFLNPAPARPDTKSVLWHRLPVSHTTFHVDPDAAPLRTSQRHAPASHRYICIACHFQRQTWSQRNRRLPPSSARSRTQSTPHLSSFATATTRTRPPHVLRACHRCRSTSSPLTIVICIIFRSLTPAIWANVREPAQSKLSNH